MKSTKKQSNDYTHAEIIDDLNKVIAHYEIGLSECLKIKKKLAAVSTAASKNINDPYDYIKKRVSDLAAKRMAKYASQS